MKHKLSGYAIKGDGTQETADRIRKVFEADGWNCDGYSFDSFDTYSGGESKKVSVYNSFENSFEVNVIPITKAEAIVFGEVKVGKWWRMEFGGVAATFMVTSIEGIRVFGYGFNQKDGWFDGSDTNSSEYICYASALDANATEATPEEVEAMLNAERLRRGLVEGMVVRSAIGSENKTITTGSRFLNNHTKMYDKDGTTCIMRNGKWATLITPAPEKSEPESIDKFESEMMEKYWEDGSPTDKFPRLMWVWDDVEMDNLEVGDIERGLVHTILSSEEYPYIAKAKSCKWYQGFIHASDIHPVTGRPATDPLEQIREVMKSKAGSYEKILRIGDILAR